ncbi:MAG TPA: hypothetical protein VNT81_16035 [Vicinamibacterales bacterium]|nr:hypothetical protein [Vicinamibacterales bacterium]
MVTVSNDERSAVCRGAGLRFLPEPDVLEHAWEQDCVCAILDDGEVARPLAEVLAGRGWRVVVVSLDLADASSWRASLGAAGRITAFIDIHPATASPGADLLWSDVEEARVKASFLLAGHLKQSLVGAGASRAWYTVVTRVDGQLGLAASPKVSGLVTAGVAALAKTLAQEWPAVHCRAIDLDPAMDQATAARLIAGEMLDPDATIVEVGHGLAGRCTIAATEAVPNG